MPNEFKVKNGLLVDQGGASVTGSSSISGSLAINASGSNVFTVDGTAGRLFSVDDSLSGSLFSVNTIAGLPIMEAFSDNTVRIGQYGRAGLYVSQSSVGIGKETALNASLDVSGSIAVSGSVRISLEPSASSTFRISSGSNTLLNVNSPGRLWLGNGTFVDAGYQLDVVGTARVSGQLTVNSNIFLPYVAGSTITVKSVGNNRDVSISSAGKITMGESGASLTAGSYSFYYLPLAGSIRGFAVMAQASEDYNTAPLHVLNNRIELGQSITYAGNGQQKVLAEFTSLNNWKLYGSQPGNYAGGLVMTIAGGFSGNFSNVDNQGAAGKLILKGGDAQTTVNNINTAGAGIEINGGLGTGISMPSDIIFSTADITGSGTALQALSNRWWIKGQTGTLTNISTAPSGSSILYIVTGNSLLYNILNTGQQVISSPTMILSSSNSGYLISQSLTHSGSLTQFSNLVGVNITPTFFSTTSSQTETALRVFPTFTGSYSGSLSSNIIVDFGTSTSGSLLLIDDITSGSVYTVNDFFGLPSFEVTSDAQVNMYDYPYVVFNKSGSYLNLGLPSTFAIDSAVNIKADLVIDEGLGINSRVAQGNGTTINDSTASLYTYTFGIPSGSVLMSAVVTGYDSASRDMISGEVKASIRYRAGTAAVVGTNFRYINADNTVVSFDITAASNTAILRAYGTGSRTYIWGATVTTQII